MRYRKIEFSQETKRDLIPAWKDYVTHYRKEHFSTNKSFNTSKSLEQKEILVDKIACAEIDKLSGMNNSTLVSKEQKVNSPMYSWAFFAVVNTLVDTVLPEVIAEDFNGIANVQVVGKGNSATYQLKSNDLFEVSTNGQSRRNNFYLCA